MRKFQQIATHRLVQINFEYLEPLFNKLSSELQNSDKEIEAIPKIELGPYPNANYFHRSVFNKITAIIGCMGRLEDSLVFIQDFPKPKSFEKKGINHFSWLDHHYSSFVVTYVSLFDISLLLTNTIFQLGIPEEECKPNIIKENDWVKHTPVRSNLIELEKITSVYKKPRNLFVHRGEIPDIRSKNGSEILELLIIYQQVRREMDPILSDDQFENLFRFESKKLTLRLDDDLIKAQNSISFLFDSLLPIYEDGKEKYKISN
jgi:hypothetical protein